ncbi:MAG: efflux RND transporter periplasmic adaptor subunit [Phycisphaerales bacterium]
MDNRNDKTRKMPGKPVLWIGGGAAVVVFAAILAWAGGAFSAPEQTQYDAAQLYTVKRESLVVSVNQPGEFESRNKIIIKSLIRDKMTIEWMIDEGTNVQPGDVLVKMDATPLLDKQTDLEQKRDNAKSSLVAAKVSLENTTSQSDSDTEQAGLNVEFAKLALEKYIAPEGEYQQNLKAAQGDVKLATTTLENARNKLEWSRKLFDRKYITESEYKADKASVDKAELDLQISEGKLALLEKYDYAQQKRKLESDLQQAQAKLERVKNKARADMENAKIQLGTTSANLTRMQRDLDQTIEDLRNAVIISPVAGRVVYAPQGSNWRRSEPLTKGSDVRYNQEIIHIPEAGSMIASIKIDESQRDKVEVGMSGVLTGPNLPDAGLTGKLSNIAEYLDPSGWWNSNAKVYSAKIDIDGDTTELRTGMNCQTQIIVASYASVIDVPLQAVTKLGEQHVVYIPDARGLQPRPVEIGLDNGRKVHIISGLKEGDRVSLTPPLQPASRKDESQLVKRAQQPDASKPAANAAPDKPAAADSTRTTARLLNRVLLARRQGLLDKLDIDEATRRKLTAALDKVEAGEPAELDAETLTTVRAAMNKLRAAVPKPDDNPPPATPGGKTNGHAHP